MGKIGITMTIGDGGGGGGGSRILHARQQQQMSQNDDDDHVLSMLLGSGIDVCLLFCF